MGGLIDWTRVPVQFAIWFSVCLVSAFPSLLWAIQLHPHGIQAAAMSLGILCFIIAYTLLCSSRAFARFVGRHAAVRWVMKLGYGIRIGVSIIIPVGMFIDLWLGALSMEIVRAVMRAWGLSPLESDASFGQVLCTTIVQGILLNLALMLLMLACYPAARAAVRRRLAKRHLCRHCGYDLRASSERCPECGLEFQSLADIESALR